MSEQRGKVRVTGIGVVATAVMVAIWVGLLAYGYSEPESWIGKLIRMPLGVPLVILGSSLLLTPVEWYFKRRGKPLFIRGHDV